MKATVNRADLASAARWVGSAVSRNPSLPVLSGMLVTALESSTGPHGAGAIVLEAFDYDNALRAVVLAEVTEADHCLVSGAMFASFLGAVDGDLVELELTDLLAGLWVSGGTSTADFGLMAEDQYPVIPKMSATPFATVDAVEPVTPYTASPRYRWHQGHLKPLTGRGRPRSW